MSVYDENALIKEGHEILDKMERILNDIEESRKRRGGS